MRCSGCGRPLRETTGGGVNLWTCETVHCGGNLTHLDDDWQDDRLTGLPRVLLGPGPKSELPLNVALAVILTALIYGCILLARWIW